MPKVLISDKLSPRAEAIFKERGLEVEVATGLDPEALKAKLAGVDGLAIRSATKVTADILENAPDLKVVGRAGIGVDNVDIPTATAKGVVVMNTPYGNTVTTAEHAVAMMFACARDIPAADRSTQAGKWEKSRFMGVELTGKTLGIIGCGNIGSIVAERARGLRMKVMAYDPFLSPERANDLSIEKVELETLLARADFISLHTPLTDSTRGIINADSIAKMKKGVRIINCARGGLVVEKDLADALDSGQVAAAAFDVFEAEPAKENVLFGRDNFIGTPHLGASTSEAQENVAIQVAEQIADYLLTGAVVNALNLPSVSAEEAPRLRPYLELAEELGSFAGQLTDSGLKAVEITYCGDIADLNTKPVTAALITGLLRPLLEAVNPVSAPVQARQRGIEIRTVTEECSADAEFHSIISLDVTSEGGTREVSGTLLAGKPRIIEVNGIPIEAEIGAHMLYINNEDKPGMIGHLGSLLGEAGINIATFHLGRITQGSEAIALVQIDAPAPDDLVKRIAALPGMKRVQALNF